MASNTTTPPVGEEEEEVDSHMIYLPFYIITLIMVLLLLASFINYHHKRKHRYSHRDKLHHLINAQLYRDVHIPRPSLLQVPSTTDPEEVVRRGTLGSPGSPGRQRMAMLISARVDVNRILGLDSGDISRQSRADEGSADGGVSDDTYSGETYSGETSTSSSHIGEEDLPKIFLNSQAMGFKNLLDDLDSDLRVDTATNDMAPPGGMTLLSGEKLPSDDVEGISGVITPPPSGSKVADGASDLPGTCPCPCVQVMPMLIEVLEDEGFRARLGGGIRRYDRDGFPFTLQGSGKSTRRNVDMLQRPRRALFRAKIRPERMRHDEL